MCCPQDPGQAPGPTPAMRGPPPPPPSQPPAPARERATGQPGSRSAEPQPKKKEFREWRRSKEKGSLTRTWTRSPAPSRTPSRGSRRSRPSVWAQCCITSYSTPWWAKHTTRNSFPSSSLCSNRYTTMPSSYYSRLAARNHGWRHQLKKHGKDCVQPWPESNIPELMAKVKANKIQRCSTVARNMRAHVPNATKATCFTMKFLQKKYEIISSCLTPIPMPISRPSSSESLYDSILYKSEIERV